MYWHIQTRQQKLQDKERIQQIPLRISSTFFQQGLEYFFVLVFLAILLCLFSCDEGEKSEHASDSVIDTITADYAGDVSYDDGLSSGEIEVLIQSGTPTVLNFCFCCDCKVTKPALSRAIESSGLALATATIDVKERIDLADEFGIRHSPFYILYDEHGLMVDTLYGYGEDELLDEAELARWLSRNLQTTDGR